jgi:hypothetical protein
MSPQKNNTDTHVGVRIPPPHPDYYLPGGDLHVIVGAVELFNFTSFHDLCFDRVGREHPLPCAWLLFCSRFADI